jgi:hypothetical protein
MPTNSELQANTTYYAWMARTSLHFHWRGKLLRGVDNALKLYCEYMTKKDENMHERLRQLESVRIAFEAWCQSKAQCISGPKTARDLNMISYLRRWLDREEQEIMGIAVNDLSLKDLEKPLSKKAAREQIARLEQAREFRNFQIKYPDLCGR